MPDGKRCPRGAVKRPLPFPCISRFEALVSNAVMRTVRALACLFVAVLATVCIAGALPATGGGSHQCPERGGQSVCRATNAPLPFLAAPLPVPQALLVSDVAVLVLTTPALPFIPEPEAGPLPPRSPPAA